MNRPDSEPARNDRDRLDEEAARWSERLQSSGAAADRSAFEAWLDGDAAKQAAFDRAEQARSVAQMLAETPELRALREETAARAGAGNLGPTWTTSFLRSAGAIAASVIIAVSSLAALWYWRVDVAPMTDVARAIVARAPDGGRLYETAVGQRLVVTLDDASVLTLDTDSRASVSYSDGERAVRLYAGQAFFDVTHDAARPFVVTAGETRVIALGTEFDVRFSEDVFAVTLVTGRVRIEPVVAVAAAVQQRRKVPAPPIVPALPVNKNGFGV